MKGKVIIHEHVRDPGSTVLSSINRFQPMRGPEMVRTAARWLNAMPAGVPGLWNLPGYPELTSGQLVDVYLRESNR